MNAREYARRANRCCRDATFSEELLESSPSSDVYIVGRHCPTHGIRSARVTICHTVDTPDDARERVHTRWVVWQGPRQK